MLKKLNIFLLAAICLVGIMIAPVKGAQTTGWGGASTPNQMRVDMTQYTADGLAGDAVVYYESSTGRLELDDALGGALLGGGTSAGEMLFWNAGGGTWDATTGGAGTNEMFWDDTNKSLGIGNDADDNTDISWLSLADTTFTDTDDFYGISVSYTKTAGDTTGADAYYGIAAAINHNFADTIGDLTALSGASTMTLGTSADVIGLLCGTAMNGGTATSSYGIYNTSDVAAGMTALTNIYGAYHIVDNDEPLGGSMWGQLTDVNQVLGAVTGNLYGHSIDLDMTATSADNTIGLLNVGTYNGALTIGDDILGISNAINITAVTTITDDVYGINNALAIADDVGDDVLGMHIDVNQSAGTVGGNMTGLRVTMTDGGTVTGNVQGIYNNSTVINPWIGMTITNGDNDSANLGVGADDYGRNYRITVTAADNASNIGRLTTGVDGRMITLWNFTAAETITLEDNEVAEGGGFSPILTGSLGPDYDIAGLGGVTLIYSSADAAWLLVGTNPP